MYTMPLHHPKFPVTSYSDASALETRRNVCINWASFFLYIFDIQICIISFAWVPMISEQTSQSFIIIIIGIFGRFNYLRILDLFINWHNRRFEAFLSEWFIETFVKRVGQLKRALQKYIATVGFKKGLF